MSAKTKIFLDTNILVYSFGKNAPEKRTQSQRIAHPNSDWNISWQVVQEFCSVALHHFERPMEKEDLHDYIDLVLSPHCTIFPSIEIYHKATDIHTRYQYRFYDALIISSALHSGADILYSEDLQHQQKIESLTIQNPFL